MGFETFLRLIQEKDLVRAGTVNKPMRQIDQNVRYLWDVLQTAAIGSTVYARRQTIDQQVKKGMAVWFNTATQRFERGLAVAEMDQTSGVVVTSEQAQIWGIVADKLNTTLADILLFGIDDIDISEAVDGPAMPGVYYLSGTNPGKLVKQKPPVSVAVLRRTPDGRVFVMPQFVDLLNRHTHYKFKLTCAPAGEVSPPAPGNRHTINSANDNLPGWLPANHAIFEGNAPEGAVFGYNLKAHPALKNAWPPVPFSNAYLEWDRGEDPAHGFQGVPLGRDGLCVFDRHGIWWMSDCYGDVPWPVDLDTANPTSYSDSSSAECPRHTFMDMVLWFTKVTFATDSTAVLSLRSGDGRLKIVCYGTEREAGTGHLEIALDLNLTVKDDQLGYLAIKEFDGKTGEFKRGPVVEGFYSLGSNVTLTGSVHAPRTIQSVEREVYQGLVGIAVQPRDTLELDVQLVRLDGAEEEFYQDFMYLGFIQEEERQYRAKLQIPSDLALAGPQLKLRFLILGRLAGTLPQLVFTGRKLPRPGGTPRNLPGSGDEFTITCNTKVLLTSNNQYVEVESSAFPVTAGDTVFFTVKRLSNDGYDAEVGILRQVGVVSAGS